jgi:hypothetical protein
MTSESVWLIRRLGLVASVGLSLSPALPAPQAAADETTFCNAYITTVPYTITQQGHYCFNRNLKLPDNGTGNLAISIQSDFVVVDLNGFKLEYLGHVSSSVPSTGIAAINRKNTTVRNGTVTNFQAGVNLAETITGGAANNRIEDLQIVDGRWGIVLEGASNAVRRCLLRNINYSFPDGGQGIPAITLEGSGGLVSGTVIHRVPGTPFAQTWGIRALGPGHVLEHNVVSNVGLSGPPGIGLFMDDATSIYRDNTVLATAIPYSGGTPVGVNYP